MKGKTEGERETTCVLRPCGHDRRQRCRSETARILCTGRRSCRRAARMYSRCGYFTTAHRRFRLRRSVSSCRSRSPKVAKSADVKGLTTNFYGAPCLFFFFFPSASERLPVRMFIIQWQCRKHSGTYFIRIFQAAARM